MFTTVAPYMGAWIETDADGNPVERRESHPIWVRGLKPIMILSIMVLSVSHPIWVRGLKQIEKLRQANERLVAPYMGAWIETYLPNGY